MTLRMGKVTCKSDFRGKVTSDAALRTSSLALVMICFLASYVDLF